MGYYCFLRHRPICCCLYQSNIYDHRTPQPHDHSHNEAPAKCCFSALLSSWLAFRWTEVCVTRGSEKHVFLLMLDRHNSSDNDTNSIHLFSWSLCCNRGGFKALSETLIEHFYSTATRKISLLTGRNLERGQTRMKSPSCWWPAAETGQRGDDKRTKRSCIIRLAIIRNVQLKT